MLRDPEACAVCAGDETAVNTQAAATASKYATRDFLNNIGLSLEHAFINNRLVLHYVTDRSSLLLHFLCVRLHAEVAKLADALA
jgi:hypothetical protein